MRYPIQALLRSAALAGALSLVTISCGSTTREVWHVEEDISLYMIEDAEIDGPAGLERAGADTYMRFRRRCIVLVGYDHFRGEVSPDHIEIAGEGIQIWLDEEQGLRITGGESVDIRVSLDQIPQRKMAYFRPEYGADGNVVRGKLEFTEEPAPRWDRSNAKD